jgi:thiol-disulfide isomerase/thioredoxin
MMMMKKLISAFLTLLVSTLFLEIHADPSDHASPFVTDLTAENFEFLTQAATGQTTGKWFVNFYSPGCGHCRKLAPTFAELAQELEQEHSEVGILVAQVDVTKNRELVKRFNITGLPTLKYFANQGMYEYPPRQRSLESLSSFVLEQYKEMEKKDVPAGPSGFVLFIQMLRQKVHDIKVLNDLLADFEHILQVRKNAAALLIVVGALFGFIVASLLGLRGSSTKIKAD